MTTHIKLALSARFTRIRIPAIILIILVACITSPVQSAGRSSSVARGGQKKVPSPYDSRPGADYMPLTEGYYNYCKDRFLQGIEPKTWKHPVTGATSYFIPRKEWDKRYWAYQDKLRKEAEEAKKKAEEEAKRKAEEEAKKKAAEEARKKAEEEKKQSQDWDIPTFEDDPNKLQPYKEQPKPKNSQQSGGFRSLLWSGDK